MLGSQVGRGLQLGWKLPSTLELPTNKHRTEALKTQNKANNNYTTSHKTLHLSAGKCFTLMPKSKSSFSVFANLSQPVSPHENETGRDHLGLIRSNHGRRGARFLFAVFYCVIYSVLFVFIISESLKKMAILCVFPRNK